MSQFEFLRNLPLGQYLAIDSILSRMDPRAKIVGFSFMIIAITVTRSIPGLLISLLAIFLCLYLAKIPFKYALRSLTTPLPFLLVLVVLQIIFNSGDFDSRVLLSLPFGPLGTLNFTVNDILAGIRLWFRLTSMILWLGLLTFIMPTSEMIAGLNSLFAPLNAVKIPGQDLAAIAQITIRFLPLLAQSAERIAKAQASRGADWDAKTKSVFQRFRRIIPLILPLFLNSLRKADNMALAMDARAYGSVLRRTSMFEHHFKLRDGLFLTSFLVLSVMVLGLSPDRIRAFFQF